MKRNGGIVLLVVALLAAVSAGAQAQALSQTLIATVSLSPANEAPPIAGLDARGTAVVTVNLIRDAATGTIVLGTANFRVDFRFPSGVTITGLHIHEGAAGANGLVRVDSGLSAGGSIRYSAGTGVVNLTGGSTDGALWQRILTNPAGFYVNLHTTVNPDGAMRGQIARLAEILAATSSLSPAQEVPPVTGVNASGLATITMLPTRGGDGTVLAGRGGSVQFTVHFAGLPANSTITGLHIHEAGAGVNGMIRVDTGLSAANPLATPSGGGSLNITVPNVPAPLLSRLVNTPQFFYVNLHTAVFPGGVMRGQLPFALAPAQVLNQLSDYSLPTGAAVVPVTLSGSGVDPSTRVLANGFLIPSSYDYQTGELIAALPAALLSGPATHYVQLADTQGRLSPPRAIVVAEPSKLNATAAVVRDAARYGPAVAPDSLGVIFGTNLATATATATGAVSPTVLAGTRVFIDGIEAQLLFVSPGQINFVVPPRTAFGTAQVVVVSGDGTVSRGTATVAPIAPALFTANGSGGGAPAGVASADGRNFNMLIGNADGTPIPLAAGAYASLFGTGMRLAANADLDGSNGVAESVTISLGGAEIPRAQILFAGPQPDLTAVDQINFQIPQSFAGRGLVEMVVTVDGRAANSVRLDIR